MAGARAERAMEILSDAARAGEAASRAAAAGSCRAWRRVSMVAAPSCWRVRRGWDWGGRNGRPRFAPRDRPQQRALAADGVASGQRVRKRQPGGTRTDSARRPAGRCVAARRGPAGRGRQQRLRVGMLRRAEHGALGPFDDAAEIHHRDPIGDVAHHREVVRNEQVGKPSSLLQVLQQVDRSAPARKRRARRPVRRRR